MNSPLMMAKRSLGPGKCGQCGKERHAIYFVPFVGSPDDDGEHFCFFCLCDAMREKQRELYSDDGKDS